MAGLADVFSCWWSGMWKEEMDSGCSVTASEGCHLPSMPESLIADEWPGWASWEGMDIDPIIPGASPATPTPVAKLSFKPKPVQREAPPTPVSAGPKPIVGGKPHLSQKDRLYGTGIDSVMLHAGVEASVKPAMRGPGGVGGAGAGGAGR
ncbi:hypothetical protein IAT38_003698 [Cryptococcus sp. DSM 104549]